MKVVLEFLSQYGYILAYTALTAIAGVLGAGMKKLYDRATADDTKRKVVETCVKAVEQLYTETLEEYLLEYDYLTAKLERIDKRIEELAGEEEYKEGVHKLKCFIGIRTHTALSIIVETGDFKRFADAQHYASFLGLTPGEDSSGGDQNRLGITKAGNRHFRTLLTEAAQSYSRGQVGYKSKIISARQNGNPPAVIAYADRANGRLRRKYYRLTAKQPPAS